MKVTNPEQVSQLQRFIEAHGVPYNPADKYRRKAYYDIQDIPAARQTDIRVFATATSSSSLHARLVYGCNLPSIGKLPGNTSFIVTEIGVELLECITAAKIVDSMKLQGYGLIREVRVEDKIALDELLLGRALKRSGTQPITAGEGTGAAVINGVAPLDDGIKLTVESSFLWGKDQSIAVTIAHNGAADLSAAMSARVSLYGLEITHGSN